MSPAAAWPAIAALIFAVGVGCVSTTDAASGSTAGTDYCASTVGTDYASTAGAANTRRPGQRSDSSETASASEAPAEPACRANDLRREELRVPSLESGIEVFVMRVRAPRSNEIAETPRGTPSTTTRDSAKEARAPVVLMHGAGSASSAIWDLRHGSYSLMRSLACAGFDTYALDARGFGGSTMVRGMNEPADEQAPLVRASEVMPDLEAVVKLAMKEGNATKVDLVGWSWGSDVVGLFASTHSSYVRRLVLFAPVYDRRWKSRHIERGGWRSMPKSELYSFFDPKTEERAVLDEVAEGLFRFTRGDLLKLPNGPYRDIYGDDAPVWNPRTITAETLIIRGDRDVASLDEHAKRLFQHLEKARAKRYEVLAGLGHFAFRERGHDALSRAIITFLARDAALTNALPH